MIGELRCTWPIAAFGYARDSRSDRLTPITAMNPANAQANRSKGARDRETFEAMLRPVLDIAYAAAYRLTGSRDDAMDLVQDATIQAYRGILTFAEGTNFKAWFLRILTNRYLKTRPKATRERAVLSLDDAEDLFMFRKSGDADASTSRNDPVSVVIDRLDSEAIQAALAMLPDKFRTVSILALVHESSYEEISETLGVPIGTVRSRLHRGRKLLQRALWDVALARGLVEGAQGVGDDA